jgi:predicted TIM-barrel fold metal-dependent hydrolase
MRRGTYDIHARIRDMDIDGVYASLVFPSMVWGFCGQRISADWVYSKIPARFPDVKLVLSEGGIGWVPMLRERMERYYRMRGEIQAWGGGLSPAELLLRNFWFCCIEEPRSMEHRRHIGADKIMLEVDYPHSDTSWPDTQARVDEMLDGLPAQEVRQISHANAAAVYRHPVPTDPQWAR